MIVIGITGKNCSGKDTIADILAEQGFGRHSLSDAIRDELQSRNRKITRESLVEVGNELRRADGPGILARRTVEKLEKQRECIVSIRNPTEVKELRKLENFTLLGVDAPVEMRYKREVARGREGGATLTLQQFRNQEERENSLDPEAQQLDAVLSMADEVLMNDGTREELRERVLSFLRTQREKVSA